ncbi:MAG TPA: hypothetical protein VGL42_02930 [Opitutaceae bacterium]|jgi:hypothetical protein
MAKFIIVTPPYVGNSFGIKTLHHLAHALNEVGHQARILFMAIDGAGKQSFGFMGRPGGTNPEFNTPELASGDGFAGTDCIVVYPEIVPDNPIGATRVVRYFLNVDGKVAGQKIALGPNDFELTFHQHFRPEAHFVLSNTGFHPAFHAANTRPAAQRMLDVTYIGKGDKYVKVGTIKDTLLITRNWPADQAQLALLLRQTRFFYTWDANSSINVEAVLCGAVPFFLTYEPLTRERIDATEMGYLPRLDAGMKDARFDPVQFERDRAALIGRIEGIQRSWPQRVAEFAAAAERHFSPTAARAAVCA